jgi:hypothetical protein
MNYEAEVRDALLTQLKTVVSETLIAEENKQFKPSDDTPWVRETLLPGIPERVEIMQDGQSRQYGVYQVDVFTPSGIGTEIADTLAESIGDSFIAGESFGSEVVVRIRRTYSQPGREDGDWYHKPLVIEWWIMG